MSCSAVCVCCMMYNWHYDKNNSEKRTVRNMLLDNDNAGYLILFSTSFFFALFLQHAVCCCCCSFPPSLFLLAYTHGHNVCNNVCNVCNISMSCRLIAVQSVWGINGTYTRVNATTKKAYQKYDMQIFVRFSFDNNVYMCASSFFAVFFSVASFFHFLGIFSF